MDNNEWISALAAAPLSSIEPDWEQIGYCAVQMLDGLMDGEIHERPRWIAPVGAVTRRSTDIILAKDELVVEALRYIRDHCGRGISIDMMLDELRASRRSLEVRMRRAIGQTPQVAIFNAQIEQAKKLLVATDKSIGQIARDCGFRHQARLNNLFKRYTGTTPGQFRRQRFAD